MTYSYQLRNFLHLYEYSNYAKIYDCLPLLELTEVSVLEKHKYPETYNEILSYLNKYYPDYTLVPEQNEAKSYVNPGTTYLDRDFKIKLSHTLEMGMCVWWLRKKPTIKKSTLEVNKFEYVIEYPEGYNIYTHGREHNTGIARGFLDELRKGNYQHVAETMRRFREESNECWRWKKVESEFSCKNQNSCSHNSGNICFPIGWFTIFVSQPDVKLFECNKCDYKEYRSEGVEITT